MNVQGLNYDRFVFNSPSCSFSDAGVRDATVVPLTDPVYAPDGYTPSHKLGRKTKWDGCPGLRYNSVRSPGNVCWALMTPRLVTSIVQTAHYEMTWNSQTTSDLRP